MIRWITTGTNIPQRASRLAADLLRVEPQDKAIAEHHLLGRTVVVDTPLADAAELHRDRPVAAGGARHPLRRSAGSGWHPPRRPPYRGNGTCFPGVRNWKPSRAANCRSGRPDRSPHAANSLDGNAAAKELEEQQNALRNEVYRANTVKVETSSRLSQINDKQSALRREQPILDRELANLLDQTGRLKTEETTLIEKKQSFEADQSSRQQQVEELTAATKQSAEDIRQLAEQLTTSRVQLGQVQEKQLACQQQVQRMTAARGELQQQVERLIRTAEAVSAKVGGVEAELQQSSSAEQTAVVQQQELRQKIESAVAAVTETGKAVQTLTGEVESLRGEHAEVEQALHALQLRLGELKVRLETLVQRTIEELQLDLPAKYHGLSADGGSGYQPGDVDWDAVSEEIRQLREKIQRLGNVNLDAISEQDELEKRSEFLSTQVADLNNSKKQLEDLINEINSESSVRFEATFNAVREHFQGMFRKLFGGGKADIYLETEIPAPKNLPGRRRRGAQR